MSAILGTILAAVGPALLGILGRAAFADPRPLRSMKRHSKLLETLPDAAKEPIEKLLTAEATVYASRRLRRSQRKVNGSNLGGLITFIILSGLLMWGGIQLATAVSSLWWIAVVIVAVFTLLIGLFGFSKEFWTYPEDEEAGVAPSP